ncbi:NACHT, LRR and PYD domains-containing protein 5-like [Chiloscyllium punctatum]
MVISQDPNLQQQQEQLQETIPTSHKCLQEFTEHERQEYFGEYTRSAEPGADASGHTGESRDPYCLFSNLSHCESALSSLGFLLTPQCASEGSSPMTFTHFLTNYVFRPFIGQEKDSVLLLRKLCKLAYEGLHRETSVLQEPSRQQRLSRLEFRSHIPAEILEREESASGVMYRFPHPLVQGFLAAVDQFLTADPSSLLVVLERHSEGRDARSRAFRQCLFGLCSPPLSRLLEELLGPAPRETIRRLTAFLESRVRAGIQSVNREPNTAELLQTLCDMYEAQDEELAKRTVGSAKQLPFGGWNPVNLSHMDCVAIAIVLQLCPSVEDLNLNSCHIGDEGLCCLVPVLHRCKVLRLNQNELSDASSEGLVTALTRTECKLHTLELWGNRLTHVFAEHFKSALHVNRTLEVLVLSHNSLGDSGARGLTAAFMDPGCKIKILRLDCNDLTDHCVQDIAFSVGFNWSLEGLDLDSNYFSDTSIPSFTSLIKRNTGLKWIRLAGNKFSLFGKTQLGSLQLHRKGCEVWV